MLNFAFDAVVVQGYGVSGGKSPPSRAFPRQVAEHITPTRSTTTRLLLLPIDRLIAVATISNDAHT